MSPLAKSTVLLIVGLAVGATGAWRVQEWRWSANTLKADNARQVAVINEQKANAQETLRRLERQKVNQDAKDKELAAARSAAVRNGADADQLRTQNVDAAKRWRDTLGNSPTGGECAAAGDAIGVFADVLGRADRRAGLLASYADTARAAGLKCERDYDALTPETNERGRADHATHIQ